MINLKVTLGGKTYPLFIGIDILARLGEIYQLYRYKPRAILITNSSFKKNSYFDIVVETFNKRNITIIPIFLTDQQVKSGLRTVQQIALQLVKYKFQPDETIVSLGGGQVANISAFIAQVIYGGVPYLQIPTTLTAQIVQSVDPICRLNSDSILNLFAIKFEHSLVWSDVALLKFLPERNFMSGFGHIIHYACLLNNGLFEFVENNLKEIFKLNLEIIEETVFRSCQGRIDFLKQNWSKPKNVKQHHFGEFMASILIESVRNSIKFGEALLLGMLVEGIIAFRSGIFNGADFERFYELLKQIPYDHFIDQINQQKLIEYLNNKISHHKFPSLSLPQQFGEFTCYNEYKLSDFISALELILSN